MTDFNFNVLLVILIIIFLVAVFYYLGKNNQQPYIRDQYVREGYNGNLDTARSACKVLTPVSRPITPQPIDNRPNSTTRVDLSDNDSDSIVDDLMSNYKSSKARSTSASFGACDPMANTHGSFGNYGRKKQYNFDKMEKPYADTDSDPRDFIYKKHKFTSRKSADIGDQFDVQQMLPQEHEEDWFDTTPLQHTKKICGHNFIHPKEHMGQNTVSGSKKAMTHDIRGDVPNPKLPISIWNMSTIEPSPYGSGLCN